MALDGISANFLRQELADKLCQMRLDKIYQPARHDLLLVFRSREYRGTKRLFISANPSAPRMHLTTDMPANPQHAPNFCMLLRKYLLGGVLEAIEQPEGERYFSFIFRTRNDLGDYTQKTLVVELIGRYSNLILLNEKQVIHDAIVHVDSDINRVREVMPARHYQAPPSQNKYKLSYLNTQSEAEIRALLSDTNLQHLTLEKALLNLIDGISPLISRELIYRAHLADNAKISELNPLEKRDLAVCIQQLANVCCRGEYQPCLYFREPECLNLFDFHALVLDSQPARKQCSSLSACIEQFYASKHANNALRERRAQVQRQITQKRKRLSKKMSYHQADLKIAVEAERFKHFGDLLSSQLYLVKPHLTEVELIDYFDPQTPKVIVPLKPELSPSGNVQHFFKRYHKAKTAGEKATAFLAKEEAELLWLDSLELALVQAENVEDVQLIAQELAQAEPEQVKAEQPTKHDLRSRLNPGKPGKKKYQAPKQANKKKSKTQLPAGPRKFVNTEGISLLVGRNNLQNDRLTLKQARKDYLWLHAKNRPGAHVIVELATDQVSDDLLKQAAELTAWYSTNEAERTVGSKAGGKIAIDYCPVRQVYKAKGAKPGMVLYDNYQTILVPPKDPASFLTRVQETE